MSNKTILIVIGLFLVAGVALLLLPTSAKKSTPGTTIPTAPTSGSQKVQKEEIPLGVQSQDAVITVNTTGFAPDTIEVTTGQKVVWLNKSGKAVSLNSADHPTHLVYKPLNRGEFANDASIQIVFDKPGTYRYHNHYNPEQTGSIVVK